MENKVILTGLLEDFLKPTILKDYVNVCKGAIIVKDAIAKREDKIPFYTTDKITQAIKQQGRPKQPISVTGRLERVNSFSNLVIVERIDFI